MFLQEVFDTFYNGYSQLKNEIFQIEENKTDFKTILCTTDIRELFEMK